MTVKSGHNLHVAWEFSHYGIYKVLLYQSSFNSELIAMVSGGITALHEM